MRKQATITGEWRPQPKQEKFQLSEAYECLFGGTKGPGKSDALLVESTRQVWHPRYKAIIMRRTYPKLEELIQRSHFLFHDKARWSSKPPMWRWPSGAIIRFMHCENEKDKYNIQGHEYQLMEFDQIEEFTETQYEFLILQNRTSSKDLRVYIRATGNPGNIGHAWVKSRFIDRCPTDGTLKYFKRILDPITQHEIEIETTPDDPDGLSRAYIFATVEDNPHILDNDPNYIKRLEAIKDINLRRALRYGDWEAFVGQFFQEWRKEIHVIPHKLYEQMVAENPVNRFMSLDYGYSNPASVGWYAVFPDQTVVRYRELYKEGLSYESLGETILRETPVDEKIDYIVADPAIKGDRKHHKRERDGEVRGEGGDEVLGDMLASRIPLVLGDNRRIPGWGRVRDYLAHYQYGDRTTALFLATDRCHNLIRTIPSQVYDETKPEDLDTKGEDHAVDELRYALMSRPIVPKPAPPKFTRGRDFWNRVERDKIRRRSVENEEYEIEEPPPSSDPEREPMEGLIILE